MKICWQGDIVLCRRTAGRRQCGPHFTAEEWIIPVRYLEKEVTQGLWNLFHLFPSSIIIVGTVVISSAVHLSRAVSLICKQVPFTKNHTDYYHSQLGPRNGIWFPCGWRPEVFPVAGCHTSAQITQVTKTRSMIFQGYFVHSERLACSSSSVEVRNFALRHLKNKHFPGVSFTVE